MSAADREFMRLAVEAARQSRGKPTDPRVGAIAVLNDELVGRACRGEKDHAEYVLLRKELPDVELAGATVYTTLEPCTVRNPPKIPCVERLIQRRVRRVVIGMLDPNPLVSGVGYKKLRQAGVCVAVTEDDDLVRRLEELNCDFIHSIETNVVHNAAKDIITLATRGATLRQREAAGAALRECLDALGRISRGEIRLGGREGGYFARWLERLSEHPDTQHVRAFIRLSAFEPGELTGKSWFESFYAALVDAVRESRLRIEYIFLVRETPPLGAAEEFIARYASFADRISYVGHDDRRLENIDRRPSIVLFDTQRMAFTHDRGDDGALIEASEWVSENDYLRLRAQYGRLELLSTTYFRRKPGEQPH